MGRLVSLVGTVGLQVATPAQATWTAQAPGPFSPSSWSCQLVDFPPGASVISFGGIRATATNELWSWNGVRWTQINAWPTPSERAAVAWALDPRRGKIVLFGGTLASFGLSDETWEWDGFGWRAIPTAHRPSARTGAAMAFDHITGRLVLFGGRGIGGAFRDTWAFDGTDWTQLATAHAPSPREEHRMVSDLWRGRIVLYGGFLAAGSHWEWTGVDWVQVNATPNPGPKADGHGLAYDPIRRRVVLHGGPAYSGAPVSGETWEWDGLRWTLRADGSSGPGPRMRFGMCYSSLDSATIVFGGGTWSAPGQFTDQWSWQSPRLASYVPAARGCPTQGSEARLASLEVGPWSGDAFEVYLEPGPYTPSTAIMLTGFSNAAWGGTLLPHALDGYGLLGCQLAVSAEIAYPMTATSSGVLWRLQIPSSASLFGLRFFNQAIVLARGVNPAGAVMSSSAEAVIGVR